MELAYTHHDAEIQVISMKAGCWYRVRRPNMRSFDWLVLFLLNMLIFLLKVVTRSDFNAIIQ